MKTPIVVACLGAAACMALAFALTPTNYAAPDLEGVKAEPGKGEPGKGEADKDKPGKSTDKDKADKDGGEEEAAIRKAAGAYAAAFAKGDAAAALAMWTSDAEFIDDDGKVHRGHDSLSPLFKKTLPSFKGYKITMKLTSVRFVKPDVALVDGEQTFTAPRGEPDHNRFTSVWIKTDGQWRIRSARDLTPDPAGESVAGRRLRELDWLIGDWISDDKDGSVNLKVKWALDKAFMVFEYEVKRKQGASSKVVQWVGWDPLREQIKSWVFDDQSGYADAYWSRNGNTWTSDSIGVLPDGATGSSINMLKYVNDDSFVWQSVRREVDGQPLPDVEAKFTRPASKK